MTILNCIESELVVFIVYHTYYNQKNPNVGNIIQTISYQKENTTKQL